MSDFTRRQFGVALAAGAALPSVFGGQQPAHPAGGTLTDVPGLTVGHYTDTRRPTGCTAILFESAAAAAVDYNSSAPGESMGVMLQPVSPVDRIHALFLTGGGVLSIPSSGGVLRFLEEHKAGFDWGNPGLKALMKVASAQGPASVFHVGFILGPRINAGGRIGRADFGARLLSTDDPEEARLLAEELDALNVSRQQVENAVLAEAMTTHGARVPSSGPNGAPRAM